MLWYLIEPNKNQSETNNKVVKHVVSFRQMKGEYYNGTIIKFYANVTIMLSIANTYNLSTNL